MIQEYLFSDKSKRAEMKKYAPKDVQIEISNIKNSDCWTISYSIPHNDENAAKILSEINVHVVETFQPVVLANESAAYFNKVLYPLINEFERKLRKLLYLKSALNPGDKASENIKDLESKELGKIFELLFSDEQFIKNVKKKINNEMTWQFTKAELIDVIKKITEDTVWDRLIGGQAVPDFRAKFISVKNYRNDVMHAHNINYKDYKESKRLFKKINKQLDVEIGKIIAVVEEPTAQNSALNYNLSLSEALRNMQLSSSLSDYARQISEIQANLSPALLQMRETLSSIPKLSPEYYEMMSRLSEIARAVQPSPEWQALRETLSSLQRMPQFSQDTIDALRRLSKESTMKDTEPDDHDNTSTDKDDSAENDPDSAPENHDKNK